jgi:aryl-alcohol dehydrogenase-like predicted oxidoreductase
MTSAAHSVQTVTLTPNGPRVPALGIGTWAWGDKLFWGYGDRYGEAELEAAFEAAIAAGVTFFDTAEIYGFGESERLLGRFRQRLLRRQPDQPVQIASKYFPLPWRFSPEAVSTALTDSLTRLGVTSIALYQVHWPFDFLLGQRKLMTALAEEVQRGRIQAVGVSNYNAQQLRIAHQQLEALGVPLAVNQVQYSLLARNIETNGVLDSARELGITILAYSPLAQGLLTGKYSASRYEPPVGARRLDPRFSQRGLEKLAPLFATLQEIGDRTHHSPAQVALNWAIAQGTVPIPGAKNAQQAEQNAGALGWSLSPDEVKALSETAAAVT